MRTVASSSVLSIRDLLMPGLISVPLSWNYASDFTSWESKDMTTYTNTVGAQMAQNQLTQTQGMGMTPQAQQYGYMYGLMPNQTATTMPTYPYYNYTAVQYPMWSGVGLGAQIGLGSQTATCDNVLTDALVANEKLRKENEDMMQHIIKLQEMLEAERAPKDGVALTSMAHSHNDAYVTHGDQIGIDAPEPAPKPRRVASPAFGQHAQLGFGDPWRKC